MRDQDIQSLIAEDRTTGQPHARRDRILARARRHTAARDVVTLVTAHAWSGLLVLGLGLLVPVLRSARGSRSPIVELYPEGTDELD
ncbi:MAG: hypothetical protein E4H28_03915 [Gemmatimonadales bacterium]|nr:MAG: hypothetical protein E4H28_03915 [Gemmatimonadales bacterium]